MSAGIDWAGPFSAANRDRETGIRYGVISCNSMQSEALDWAGIEYDYGTPHCPKCGDNAITAPCHTEHHDSGVTIISDAPDAYEDYAIERGACGDYACEACEYLFDGDEAFSDEPLGWSVSSEGIEAIDCLDNDAMVVKSPYFTRARYCSPCVPGACSLDSPDDDGAKCYCFGHDWFDDNTAPYPVYRVDTGELVPAGVPS